MNTKNRLTAFVLVLVSVLLLVSTCQAPAMLVKAEPIVEPAPLFVPWFAGSDCIANRASGDFYPHGQNSSHCDTGLRTIARMTAIEPVLVLGSVNVPSVVVPTTVVVVPTPVVVVPATPVAPVEPVTPVEDDACKNKNSGKDGTPAECNAGKGQEKHNP